MTSLRLRRSFRIAALAAISTSSIQAKPADFNEVGRYVEMELQNDHFSGLPFGAQTSGRILDEYLRLLDPSKVYFLQSDVDRMKVQYGSNLCTLLIQQKAIDAARDIHGTFKARVTARTAVVEKFLADEAAERGLPGTTPISRRDAAWPKDDAEANTLLCQQIEASVINEVLLREQQAKHAAETHKPDPGADGMPVRKRVLTRYARFINTVGETAVDDIANGFFDAVALSHDPHTSYMMERDANRFDDSMRADMVGIGVEFRPADEGGVRITGVVIGGPADLEGHLQLDDRIVGIDATASGTFKDIKLTEQSKVVDLIRGAPGTPVCLKVVASHAAAGDERRITINRAKVEIKDAKASALFVRTTGADNIPRRMGVITLPSFYDDFKKRETLCSVDVQRLLRRLVAENIDGLILDLRDNGGGSLEEVRRMTGFFTGSGPVLQQKSKRGEITVSSSDAAPPIYRGPLVVLVNKASASASEILAGALQDYNRAVIVGDPSTFGKGTVQDVIKLEKLMPFFSGRDGAGSVKVTTRKFYRPSGFSTQLDGVASDIIVPGPVETAGGAELGEQFLDHAFPRDRVKPAAGFSPLNRERLFLPKLKALSEARVAAEKDFAWFAEDARRARDQRAANVISLDLAQRRQEFFEQLARLQQRNADRRERFKAIEAEDAKKLSLSRLSLDDASKGADFHAFDPKDEFHDYMRRSPDALADADTPSWPSGIDPIKREGLHILEDLIAASDEFRLADLSRKDKPAEH